MAARFDPARPPAPLLGFLTERHLATLSTLRPDGTPHVVPVGFSFDPADGLARVITWGASRKARNVAARPGELAVLCQFEGARWVTLEGPARLRDDADRVAGAVARYAARYRDPKARDDRVVIEVQVTLLLGSAGLGA